MTTQNTILIVEDDPKISKLIRLYLEKPGFDVCEVGDGEEAIEAFKEKDPCFVILDLMLPKKSGEEVCHWIRRERKSDIPIIMVSAKVGEKERIAGLQMGADDYVTMPFSPQELVTRVETVLRRTADLQCNKISLRGINLKPLRSEVLYQGEPISLTHHEFRLLYFFMRHPNQVLTRERLLDELYPHQEKLVSEQTIDVHVGKLREKLPTDSKEEMIETVRGMGYRFLAF